MATEPTILYEQPVNELIRLGLRFEHLYHVTQQSINGAQVRDSHDALISIIDMLNLLDRPDLKAKYIQEFQRRFSILKPLSNNPRIDSNKLQSVLEAIQSAMSLLQGINGKLVQTLRTNSFINGVKQHLLCPGCTTSFDTPEYHYWLHQPHKFRLQTLQQWFADFVEIYDINHVLIQLSRELGTSKTIETHDGFYQTNLEANPPTQLIQVEIPTRYRVFPEISVGRHRLNVRFLGATFQERPIQITQPIHFTLKVCAI